MFGNMDSSKKKKTLFGNIENNILTKVMGLSY